MWVQQLFVLRCPELSFCRRLWAHEALRIFHDRLVNDEDRRWFGNYLKAAVQEHLHLRFDEVFAPSNASAGGGPLEVLSATRSLLYCNFLTKVWHALPMCWPT